MHLCPLLPNHVGEQWVGGGRIPAALWQGFSVSSYLYWTHTTPGSPGFTAAFWPKWCPLLCSVRQHHVKIAGPLFMLVRPLWEPSGCRVNSFSMVAKQNNFRKSLKYVVQPQPFVLLFERLRGQCSFS